MRRDRLVEWTADLHEPNEPGNWPALVFLPGQSQGPSSYVSFGEELAAHGVAVLVINYPDTSPASNPNNDAEGFRRVAGVLGCANRFVQERVEEAGSELDRLVFGGMSLGGGVAAHAALAGESLDSLWQEFSASRDLPRVMECVVEEGSTHVDALVGVAGAYDAYVGYEGDYYGREFLQGRDMQAWELLYGALGLNPDVQVRLLHSRTDGLIPYENSELFVSELTAVDIAVELTEFDGGHSFPPEETVAAVLDILGVNEAVDS
jgi:predicted esterase